jgi:hypothetical protein
MGNGEMGEGNGIRPVHCKGSPQRLRRRCGLDVSVAVMEQSEFPFVPSVPFQSASGSWLMACGDASGGFTPLLSCPAAQAFLMNLKMLN